MIGSMKEEGRVWLVLLLEITIIRNSSTSCKNRGTAIMYQKAQLRPGIRTPAFSDSLPSLYCLRHRYSQGYSLWVNLDL